MKTVLEVIGFVYGMLIAAEIVGVLIEEIDLDDYKECYLNPKVIQEQSYSDINMFAAVLLWIFLIIMLPGVYLSIFVIWLFTWHPFRKKDKEVK